MKTKELELYTAKIEGDIIKVEYALFDENQGVANVSQDIKFSTLSEFINDGDLNIGEFINSSLDIDRVYFDNDNFIADNLFRMVELYLNRELCNA